MTEQVTVQQFMRVHKDLYPSSGAESWVESLFKSAGSLMSPQSNQGTQAGRQEHPFDRRTALRFTHVNEHHSACINTATSAIVGLGHKFDSQQDSSLSDGSVESAAPAASSSPPKAPGITNVRNNKDRLLSKVDVSLDPLCTFSWADALRSAAEDYTSVGEGYLEVTRLRAGNKIVGVHHLPAASTFIELENDSWDYHYSFDPDNSSGTTTKHFAKFGDTEYFNARMAKGANGVAIDSASETYSEVIHFRRPNSSHRWYGMPRWLSAVPAIELSQCYAQFKYDFFLNRGVPEFMLFLLGAKLSPDDWKIVTNALKSNIGLGNSHKSFALNVSDTELKVQLEKLAMDSSPQDDGPMKESLALSVVTAHGVPPLLAGILVPGKLGSNNELPNALMAFQALVAGPDQRIFMQTLGKTLGSKEAGLGLTLSDFEFYTVLDEIDLSTAATVGGMKQPLAEANAQGRDLTAGMKH